MEEHVVWRIADLLRGFAELVRWAFERVAWAIEERLVWPLHERAAGLWISPRAAGALATLAVAAVAFGVVLASGEQGDRETIPGSAPVAAVAPASPAVEEAEPSEAALQGVPPEFGVENSVGVVTGTNGETTGQASNAAAVESGGESAESDEAGATTSSEKPVPAGPAAMKVARRFSEAFVFYEIGERPARALAVFEETAAPGLAKALADRPPRLPESTDVPRARVLNLVPGPRRGKVYTVSASLLRVGVTSELRLKLTKEASAWYVTDVRG